MHLTALVESFDHVCARYRLVAFRPFLEAAGHTLELVPVPRSVLGRLQLFRKLRGADVVLQRRLLPNWQLKYLRSCARRLLFDFDDSVFLRDSYSPRGLQHAGRLRRFAATLGASDAILAGNSFLRARALAWTERPKVRLLPTCVDPEKYSPAEPQSRAEVVVVWVGSSSTLKGLERCAPLLEELGSQIPALRLKVICDRTLALRHLIVNHHPWSAATEAADIASADIGISWIPDDEWSRGKCGLKVLQYMAAGLPVVANPVGVHIEMVRHQETGFLAETPGEWTEAIYQLASDADLRQRMGRAGRQLVEGRYSVSVGARVWLSVLEEMQSAPARSA
jgi:glycosyltransferase involved in cell wall biosynthesis